ncbi:hypothetical protein CDSM653_02590 [Caldanaerobacter subterraneus subsp. pacificus DSM 12653]|uniref:Uncharacterized protein n=1 Tax=Caldanaerobacter subterraneus subsp. pacificus DSM 12653 TaxID=391606 RepID=A0A0F5PJ13_9THEO|nr:hypothetical protein CDSM653_02590 [Caldanaerobacter subterraneus subsp. pacificus DSM 12653]
MKNVKKKENTSVVTGLIDMISPLALEFNARQIVCNDQLARILVIAGYPSKTNVARISRKAGRLGVVFSFYFQHTDTKEFINSLNKVIAE